MDHKHVVKRKMVFQRRMKVGLGDFRMNRSMLEYVECRSMCLEITLHVSCNQSII